MNEKFGREYHQAYYIAHKKLLKDRAQKYYNDHRVDEKWMLRRRELSKPVLKRCREKIKLDPIRMAAHRKQDVVRSTRWQQKKRLDSEWLKQKRMKCNKWNRENYEHDPSKVLIRHHRRRARELNAPGTHTLREWKDRVAFYGWKCFYCHKPLSKGTLTKEHRIPLCYGGSDFASNLVPACKSCNSKKFYRIRKIA